MKASRWRTYFGAGVGVTALAAVTLILAPISPAFGFGSSVRPPVPSVSAGGYMSCALNSAPSQTAACWGDNVSEGPGQATPPAGVKFIEVNAGYSTACGVTIQLNPVCWGSPLSGGNSPPAAQVNHIVAGFNFGCAIKSGTASLICWGANDAGQATPPAGAYKAMSVGIRYGCALDFDTNAIKCWGDNSYGQQNVPTPNNYVALTTGNFDTCGIRPDGTAVCWGRNAGGQANAPSGTFTQISAGFQHVCGLRPDQTITCWGNDTYGQASPPSGTFTQVSAGTFTSCAMPTSGPPAVCWGQNAAGRVIPTFHPPKPPAATVGTPYSYQFKTSYLSPAGTFTVTGGTLPPGLNLSPAGLLSGTPTSPGTFSGIQVSVGNGLSPVATDNVSIMVAGGGTTTTSTSTSTSMPTTSSTTSTTIVGPPAQLTCSVVTPTNGPEYLKCRATDNDGLRRVIVVDTTTRVKEQSIGLPGKPVVTRLSFRINSDGNSHRVRVIDKAGHETTFLVAPDGTVTPA